MMGRRPQGSGHWEHRDVSALVTVMLGVAAAWFGVAVTRRRAAKRAAEARERARRRRRRMPEVSANLRGLPSAPRDDLWTGEHSETSSAYFDR
jgi:hypothetical protein